MKRSRLSTILLGISGEYFVAAELSRRGYVASLTLRNTRGIDILASNTDATKIVGIQVKANQGRKRYWLLNEKAESDTAEKLFYIFVNLNDHDAPDYYIVPRAVVAKYVREGYAAWQAQLGRDGKPRGKTTMRVFRDEKDEYRGRWDLLGLDPT